MIYTTSSVLNHMYPRPMASRLLRCLPLLVTFSFFFDGFGLQYSIQVQSPIDARPDVGEIYLDA